ncbi:hypothetical protein [Pseudorhodoferax sp. Leaf267]|uniref:hypothetical protein n=1 Tax=Pseudorhodoferax sp. Leaf267 TaxID=1736316 RepID=UPI0009EC2345|nr:hypothetical protein [Pseudorhodoferax sp. Leaf267]
MSKVTKRPTIVMPTVAEDRAITETAKADPDAQSLTPKQLQAMTPLKAVRGRRGRPPARAINSGS